MRAAFRSIVALLTLASVRALDAQHLAPVVLESGTVYRPDTTARPREPAPQANVGGMAAAGVAAGAVGLLAGAKIGSALGGGDRVCGDDPCGFVGAVWGAAAGVSIMIPLGVHVAGGRRGSYATELATSLAIGALGMTLAFAVNGVMLVAVPVAQLVASILIEQQAETTRSP